MTSILRRADQWRRWVLSSAALLTLAGCVDSATPLLTGAQPVWGAGARFQLYSLSNGTARDPEVLALRWDGNAYRPSGAKLNDVRGVTIHPFEGRNFIVQSESTRADTYEYALARRMADGVYLVTPIDEEDADEATRLRFCRPGGGSSCRIITEEALFALARAAASRNHESGGLALLLADLPPAPPPKKRR